MIFSDSIQRQQSSDGLSAIVAGRKLPKRVDWPVVVGAKLATTRPAGPSDGVVSVLAAVDELGTFHDLDQVLRRAVELGRDRLGLERAALFLLDESGDRLCGTWGTGPAGETTDEHHIYFSVGFNHREAIAQALGGLGRWLCIEGAPLSAQIGERTVTIGHGWNCITPIISARGPVGIFVNDTALSSAPLDEAIQVKVAVFCRLLASIIEQRREEAASLPWKPLLGRLPTVGSDGHDSLVVRVVQALHDDPTLDGAELGRAFGVSPSKLTHRFKVDMGVSLVEYRNRLRLERFLARVDRGGGNLLQAALDAGFGSYAQFHRVFRSMLGISPREHVTGRR